MDELKTTVIEYGDGIFAIDQQMVRAFLICGSKRALLLDTGAVRVDIISIIRGITSLPVTVVLTHGDGDHIGNLQDFSDAFVHENDMHAVASHENCKNVMLHPLSEGDTFDIGTRTLSVLFTPGHTAGSVCLLDKDNKILFAGDTISNGPIFMFGDRRNMKTYLETLRRLEKMENEGAFETVFCCHNICPTARYIVRDLISCINGIMDKTISGIPAPMPVTTDEKPLLAKYGSVSVLF